MTLLKHGLQSQESLLFIHFLFKIKKPLSGHWLPGPSLRKDKGSCRNYDALRKQVRHFISRSYLELVHRAFQSVCCGPHALGSKFPIDFARLLATVVLKHTSCVPVSRNLSQIFSAWIGGCNPALELVFTGPATILSVRVSIWSMCP